MTRIASGLAHLAAERAQRAPSSRVLMWHLFYTQNLQPNYIISEVLGKDLRVLHVWGRVVHTGEDHGMAVLFNVMTGTGAGASYTQVRDEWEAIIPVRWEGGDGTMWLGEDGHNIDFSMDRFFGEKGRRIGVWGWAMGSGDVTLEVSVKIAE